MQSHVIVIVGSGAAGTWAAKELTAAGVPVCIVEAGSTLAYFDNPLTIPVTSASKEADLLRQSVQSKCSAYNSSTHKYFVDDIDNPYTTPAGKPFNWIRGRQMGGRMILWGRGSLRMSDFDLRAASNDGYGDDWPITYAELAPHYDKVEESLLVIGTKDGLPHLPNGNYPKPLRCPKIERELREVIQRTSPEMKMIGGRVATERHDRCLTAARETGLLTVRQNAIVSQVLIDPSTNLAKGVVVVDRLTKKIEEISARIVILCASTIETTRILLNSATSEHPAGLGNSSGALGRYLMDHTHGPSISGVVQDAFGPNDAEFGASYIPRFRNLPGKDADFIRGYGIWAVFQRMKSNGEANASKLDPCSYIFTTFGEVLARSENRVTLDPNSRCSHRVRIWRERTAHGERSAACAREDSSQCRFSDREKEHRVNATGELNPRDGNGTHGVLPKAICSKQILSELGY